MVKDYDCRNAIEEVIGSGSLSAEELELANESFESAEILASNGKYRGAYIQLFVGLQNLGQAVLLYRFRARSKSKMCQFRHLYEEGLIDDSDLDFVKELVDKRNDVYYNNPTPNAIIDKEYEEKYSRFKELVEKLEGLL